MGIADDTPRLSIVIPAYNAAATIGATLAAIAEQAANVAPFEVIVADNGSSDATRLQVEAFMPRLPLRIVDASERPRQAFARNKGAEHARGALVVFTDADDVPLHGWLAAWMDLDPSTSFASGPTIPFEGSDLPDPSSCTPSRLPVHMGFRSYALGTNFAVRRTLLLDAGGFDEAVPPAEDVELSWRLQATGTALVFVPNAVLAKRERTGKRATLRQYFAYGRVDPELYRRYRSAGVPRPDAGAVLRSYLGLVLRVPLLANRRHRERWLHQAGRRAGRLIGSINARVFYP